MTPEDLLKMGIKEALSMETLILEALPSIIEGVTSEELKTALQNHLSETEEQKKRLENHLGTEETSQPMVSNTAKALVANVSEMPKVQSDDSNSDLGVLMSVSRIEHDEVAVYTSLCAVAKALKNEALESDLTMSLREELKAADKLESMMRDELKLPSFPSSYQWNEEKSSEEKEGSPSEHKLGDGEGKSQEETTKMPRMRNESESQSQRTGTRERDDQGRFVSSRDRDMDQGRDRDSDEDRGRGEGRGGWFGDPEGHSRASREGWEHREGGRDYGRDRESYGRGRDRDDDDDRSRGGGRGEGRGWYGDPEGHSRASREGWEHREGGGDYDRGRGSYGRGRDDDYDRERERYGRGRESYERGQGYGDDRSRGEGRGWYGDSEAHSRAAREGWEHRGGGRDYDRGRESYGRGRDREDEQRYGGDRGRGEGRGGWFGDYEGHSRAAREGWEHREGGRDYDRGRESYGRDRESEYGRDRERSGRGRDYEDDRSRGEGRGWYGDPEGHSRASKEGWEHRDR